MPVHLRITVDDDGAVAALRGLEARLGSLRPAMDEIGAAMQASTHQRFITASGPDGKSWPALSAETKKRRGDDARPLRDRGHLFDSISWRAGAAEVAVGSVRKYARIQQLGGKAGRGRRITIPARPYLGVDREDRREIAEILRAHVEG
jgi:phage virion morphogenesis protein